MLEWKSVDEVARSHMKRFLADRRLAVFMNRGSERIKDGMSRVARSPENTALRLSAFARRSLAVT